MIIRFFLFSLLVAGFVLVIRAIVSATRHLETRHIEEGLWVHARVQRTSSARGVRTTDRHGR